MNVNHNRNLSGIGQQRARCIGQATRSIGFDCGKGRRRIDRLHVAHGDREAQIVALGEPNTQVTLIERKYLPNHVLLRLSDRIQLNTAIGISQLRRKIVAENCDPICIHSRHVMLVSIVSIALLVVCARIVQRVRGFVPNVRVDDYSLSTRARKPTAAEVNRIVKTTSCVGCWIDLRDSGTDWRLAITNSQTQCPDRQRCAGDGVHQRI